MGANYDLFGGKPPHVRDSATSEAAADSIEPHAGTMQAQVLRLIESAGDIGLTDDEVEHLTGLRHQTASARRRELFLKNRIIDSGRTRLTRSGRKATVWVRTPEAS